MSPTLTVRTDECDISGDTVLFGDDATVTILGRGETETVPVEAVESVIAGKPAGADTGKRRASA